MVLEMSVEEQMERVRGRNGGSQHVVNLMKVGAAKFISERIWKKSFGVAFNLLPCGISELILSLKSIVTHSCSIFKHFFHNHPGNL